MMMKQLKLFQYRNSGLKAFKILKACSMRTHGEKMEMIRGKYPFFKMDIILKKARERMPEFLSKSAVEKLVANVLLDYTPTEFRIDCKKWRWKFLNNYFYAECKKIINDIIKEIGNV